MVGPYRTAVRRTTVAVFVVACCCHPAAAQPLPESYHIDPPVPPGAGDVISPTVGSDLTSAGTGPALPATAPDPSKPALDVSWRNGVYVSDKDENFLFHIGGAVQYDAAFYGAPARIQFGPGSVGPFNDGVNLRRGRLRAEGTLYKSVDFLFEMEFFNGFSPAGLLVPAGFGTVSNSPGPTDANITIKKVSWLGNIRIGSQKEPFSLEHINSYRYLEFLERSYLFDAAQPTAFNNGFSPGISAFRTAFDDRMTMALGVFKNESDLLGFGLGDGQLATTGRLTVLPVYVGEGERMLHFGVSASYRDPDRDLVLIRVRPLVRNGPFVFLNVIGNTGQIGAASQTLVNFETAAVNGPFTFQAEYLNNMIGGANVGGSGVGTLSFQGFYVSGLCFLTGERRPWNPKTASFGRVVPNRPIGFGSDCGSDGIGAWEVGVRYSYLELNDGPIVGGVLNDVTLGLNWYLNPNAKLQFNYDIFDRSQTGDEATGVVHAFGARMAFDF